MAETISEVSATELVERARGGDAGAFEQIIEHHAALVYTIARSRLNSHESAEDLVQEAFLRAHLNLHRLSDPERLAPWLASLTRNLAIDWIRRGRRRSPLLPLVPLDEEACRVSDLSAQGAREIMMADEQSRTVRRAIEQLPAEQREMVLLHFGEELTQTEIASRFGVRQSRVSRQLKRALATLRTVLEADLAEADLRRATPPLRMPRSVIKRTASLVAAATAMSVTAKASLAATAMATQPAVSLTVKAGTLGLIQATAAKLAAGGLIMKLSKGAAVVAIAVIGTMSYQQVKSQGKQLGTPSASNVEAISLRPHTAPGAEWTYTLVGQVNVMVSVPMQGIIHREISMASAGTEQLIEVEPDGGAWWEVRETDRRLTRLIVNGEPQNVQVANATMPQPPSDHFEYTCDAQGRVITSDYGVVGDPPSDIVLHAMGMHVLSGFPAEPVPPGGSWTRLVTLPHTGGQTAVCTSTLDRVEEIDGQAVAVILRRAEIDVDTPIAVSVPEIPGDSELVSIWGTITAEERIVVESGLPLRFDLEMALRLPIRTVNPLPEGEMESTIDVWQRTSATLVFDTGETTTGADQANAVSTAPSPEAL
jgi:RNA polymerase sigma-70 factor, ECF subfamily